MKLSKNTILQIENIIKICKTVDIQELKILPDTVAAINKSKTLLLISDFASNDEFNAMGIKRTDLFLSRFNLVKDKSDYVIEAETIDDNVKILYFKAKGVKAEYRCAAPDMIRVPTGVKDTFEKSFKVDEDTIETLVKASNASDAENITIEVVDGDLLFKLEDITSDVITIDANTKIKADDFDGELSFSYNIKSLFPLIKNMDEYNFEIGNKGLLKVIVSGMAFYLLPRL